MRIYLTGFMGAGKTTVGRELARRIAWPFVDLDQEIEQRSGLAVREIFAQLGEPEFRRHERELLAETYAREPLVVAVGGGTLADAATLAATRQRGIVVWLHPTFETLLRRVGPLGKADRPLFRDEAQARALYQARLPFYRAADLTVDVAPAETIAEVSARILLGLHLPESACST